MRELLPQGGGRRLLMIVGSVLLLAGVGAFALFRASEGEDSDQDGGNRGEGDRNARTARGGVGTSAAGSRLSRGAPRAKLVGANRPINLGADEAADVTAHNSPTLVRNPTDARQLVVASRIDKPRYSCAVHVSNDGGAQWSQTPIPTPQGEEPKCHAPDVAFGADGMLYVSFVTLEGPRNTPHAAWVSSSDDGGRTLSRPRRALGPLSFQVRLAADSSRARRLYLTWVDAAGVDVFGFKGRGNPIRFARSDDGGRSWSRAARVSDPARDRVLAPSLARGSRGALYVLYLDVGEDRLDYAGGHGGRGGPPDAGPFSLVVARSLDGGRSWPSESVVEDRLVPSERFLALQPPYPSLAVDRDSGHIYVSFEDRSLGDPDVRVWRSERGSSWQETRVNDTREGDGTAQYRPKLAVAPNGRLDVLYYDRRSDPENVMNEVSLQSSFDGGESFTGRLRVSDRAFDSRIGPGSERGMPDLGDRLALLSTNKRSLAVWSDTRAGTQTSGKQDLVQGVVAFSGP